MTKTQLTQSEFEKQKQDVMCQLLVLGSFHASEVIQAWASLAHANEVSDRDDLFNGALTVLAEGGTVKDAAGYIHQRLM